MKALTLSEFSKNSGEFKMVFTHEPSLKNQYYEIREKCYRAVEGGPSNFSGAEDCYDPISDTLIILNKEKVIGGARIIGSFKEHHIKLPIEEENFYLREIFTEYHLKKNNYCEFSRLAILPEFRSLELLKLILKTLSQKSISRNYKYLFSMAPLVQVRCYRRAFKSLNFPYPYIIHNNIDIPNKSELEVGNLKMYLASMQFASIEKNTINQNMLSSDHRRDREAA